MNDPAVVARWEREPHRRQTHLYRLSEVCRHLVTLGFAAAQEKEKLQQQADGFAVMAGRQPLPEPQQEVAMGNIVSFGGHRFGFIQTRDGRTLYFHQDDVLSSALQEDLQDVLRDASSAIEIPVDFEVEPQPTRTYDRSVRLRRPGFVIGTIKRLGTVKRADVGFIELTDGRLVHFHFSALPNPMTPPAMGAAVLCRLEQDQLAGRRYKPAATNWTTNEIELLAGEAPRQPLSSDAQRILAHASLAREQGDSATAAAL